MIAPTVLEEVVLKQDNEIEQRPSTSLCMVVSKKVEALPRCLETVGPHVDELVIVLADCDDEATRAFSQKLDRNPLLADIPRALVPVNHLSHPRLYQLDVPETFTRGRPLDSEEYAGPHGGLPFVSDWAAVRNLGFACSREWRLSMDADEVLLDPDHIAPACCLLNEKRRDVGYATSRRGGVSPRSVLGGRLARNLPALRWEGSARESLEGSLRPSVLDGFLKFSQSSSVFQDADVFRVLYAEARELEWEVPPVNLLHMAKTAPAVGMEGFAQRAIEHYLDSSLYPEERAWAAALRGEIFERTGSFVQASDWYARSLEEHPGWKSALRLSRSRFREGRWRECLEEHDRAVELSTVVQISDDGLEDISASLIYVASSLRSLGHLSDFRRVASILRQLYPASPAVAKLCEDT